MCSFLSVALFKEVYTIGSSYVGRKRTKPSTIFLRIDDAVFVGSATDFGVANDALEAVTVLGEIFEQV